MYNTDNINLETLTSLRYFALGFCRIETLSVYNPTENK